MSLDVLLNKAQIIRRCLVRIQGAYIENASDFAENLDAQDVVVRRNHLHR